MKKRPIIAIDLDDTIAATTAAIVRYASKMLGQKMVAGDITNEAYWARYGVSDREAIQIVHGYNLAGFPGLKPIDGALEILKRLATSYDLHVLTSRDPISYAVTDAWVAANFPAIFSGVHCLGNQYVSMNVRTKAEACVEIGAEAIIDDSVTYLEDCLNGGVVLAVLFGDYPWNTERTSTGMRRAASWVEVGRLFDGQG